MLQNSSLTDTVSVISSNPPCKEGNSRFTTVPLKSLLFLSSKESSLFKFLKNTLFPLNLGGRCVQIDVNTADALLVYRLTSIQLMRFLCTDWPQYSWCAFCVQIDVNTADALLVYRLTSIQLMRFLCTDWPQYSWCASCVQIDVNTADALLV